MLAGCADRGPIAVYTQAGVAAPDPAVKQNPNANPFYNFQTAAANAQTDSSTSSYQQFMRSGFALIYVRCNEYFDNKGSDQATASLIRDSIAPLAAVVSGIFALHTYGNPKNADHDIALLTLGTTTAVAGLDVYSKNFLFGAENIESVRGMVNEELNAHALAALSMSPTSIEEAAIQITDNQRICYPSHILASTRTAISNERFSGIVTGSGGPVGTQLLSDLGTYFKLTPPIVTADQAGLFFAAANGFARTEGQLKLVRAGLLPLGEDINPVGDDGSGKLAIKNGYPPVELTAIFNKAPAVTIAYLRNRSKAIMEGAETSYNSSKGNVNGGTRNFDAFKASPDAAFEVPPSPSEADGLRRVRVTAQ